MDRVFCWKNYFLHPQQDVKLENPKYCRLYSEYKNTTKEQITKYEHCKTMYTKCDYLLEQSVHEEILKLEKLLKQHEELKKQVEQMQKELITDMWTQSQRYLILTSGVCVKMYPEIVSQPTEQRALCRFHKNLRKINASNCLLASSIENIRTCQAELNRRCEQLDMRVESIFLNGSYSLKSLFYIRSVLNDLFQYYYCNLCKLKFWAQLLDPGDSVSVENYTNLIKSNSI